MSFARHSGLPGVGALPWGTHACLIYENAKDLIEVVGPYLQAGIHANEYCLWITPPSLSAQEAFDLLRQVVPETRKSAAKSQLCVVSATDWYRNGAELDCNKALRGFGESLERALNSGFAGLRCIGGPGTLAPPEWDEFLVYEAACNATKEKMNLIGICTYGFHDCTAAQLLDVMQRHQAALIKKNGNWGFIEHIELRTALIVKEQADRFRRVKEALPIGIYEADSVGNYVYINECCSRMMGLSAQEAQGEGWAKAVHPSDRESILQQWQEAVKRQVTFEAEYRLIRQDGTVIWVLGKNVPLRDSNGDFWTYIGTITDITDQKQVQEKLERSVYLRTQELATVNAQLLEKIRDLEQFHDVVVGRELRMMELEKQIKTLQSHLGKSPSAPT